MNAKALAKRRSKTALRLAANIIFAILVLLPLLYAVSIALMPSNELFTTDLNLFPKHPTLQNFKEAFTTVPLLRFILFFNSRSSLSEYFPSIGIAILFN